MNTATVRWSELLRRRYALRIVAVSGGLLLHATNVYVVTTVLPSVVADIGGLEYYAGNTTLFVVASILGSALAAWMLARFGPRRAYLCAFGVFALGTAGCATAPSMPWMLEGRFLQGLGGGLLFALGYPILRVLFPERLWARCMALRSGMWVVATLLGPTVGGLFAELGSWRLAFWAMLPATAALALAVVPQLPEQMRWDERPRAALPQIALLLLSVVAVTLASSSALPPGARAAALVVGAFLGIALVRVDRRAVARLLPTGAYTLEAPLGRLYAAMCLVCVGLTTEIFVPYFLGEIHGCSPLWAGYLTALMGAGWTLAALLFSGHTGAVALRLVWLGPVVVVLSLVTLAITMPQTTELRGTVSGVVLALALTGTGFGIGMAWPHLLTRVFHAAPPGEESLTATSVTLVQLYAMALGTAVGGLVVNAGGMTSPGGLAGARHAAAWLFAVFAIATGVGVWRARKITA